MLVCIVCIVISLVDLMNSYLKKGLFMAYASGSVMAYASRSLLANCLMLFVVKGWCVCFEKSW